VHRPFVVSNDDLFVKTAVWCVPHPGAFKTFLPAKPLIILAIPVITATRRLALDGNGTTARRAPAITRAVPAAVLTVSETFCSSANIFGPSACASYGNSRRCVTAYTDFTLRMFALIICGPEYAAPEHLERLRARGLGTKRTLALREFALGVEAVHRFVEREPLRRVHECVFGVLALESEPVDPRL